MIKSQWKHLQKILCVRLDNMGDVLLTAPAIQALRQTFPSAHIALLTSTIGSRITPFLPMIDQTIIYDAPWMRFSNTPEQTISVVTELQNNHFDAGMCFGNFSQNSMTDAFLLFLAHIPKRLGYSRENPHYLLTDWVPDTEPFTKVKHGVQRQLDLVKYIGASSQTTKISLTISPSDIDAVTKLLLSYGIDPTHQQLVVHPGVSDPKRQFPLDVLGQAVHELTKHYQVILTGTEKEMPFVETIQEYAPKAVSFCSKLTVGQLVALLSLSDVLISNNTGPVHIAAGVGTPIVDLYARTNPEHTPWQVPQKILYFDVEKKYQTSNQILLYTLPKGKIKLPSSLDIVLAVENLLLQTTKKNQTLYE